MTYKFFGQHTERLLFRKLVDSDFEPCLEFFRDPRSNRYWKSNTMDAMIIARQWFDKQLWRYENNKGAINILVNRETKLIIGWCGLILQSVDGKEELEVAYSIIPTYWNCGYATEAAKKCIDFAFENKRGLTFEKTANPSVKKAILKDGSTLVIASFEKENGKGLATIDHKNLSGNKDALKSRKLYERSWMIRLMINFFYFEKEVIKQ